MSNRNWYNELKSGEPNPVFLFGECTIGAAGAVSGIKGNGISTITKESGTGNYSFLLEDKYNKLLSFNAAMVAVSTTVAKTCLTGRAETQTVTFKAKSASTAGDYFVLTDAAGLEWAISLDIAGTDPAPTGAVWAAIPAGQKAHVDVSGATTGADIAGAVETAFDALVSVPFATTVSTADIAFVNATRANIVNCALYKKDDSGAATSFTVVNTVAGIDSAVEFSAANTITIAAHGFKTGRIIKMTIDSGTVPAGLTAATAYYVIYVDDNNIKLATTLANAEAGTAITITDQGTADKILTLTPQLPVGSNVSVVEVTDLSYDAKIAAGTKVTFTCYDSTGSAVNPLDASIMKLALVVRNSNLKSKGE